MPNGSSWSSKLAIAGQYTVTDLVSWYIVPQSLQRIPKSMTSLLSTGKSTSGKPAQAKSARSARNKSAVRDGAQVAEQEEDEFNRAISRAIKSGAFDEMIAEALQDERDGKTTPI